MITVEVSGVENFIQKISGIPWGTLVEYDGRVCIWSWAGLSSLDGQLFWSKDHVEKTGMTGTILPSGSQITLTQK